MKGNDSVKIYVLRRRCTVRELAREAAVDEKTLMDMNGLERCGLLPAGLSLILPERKTAVGEKEERELFAVASPGTVSGASGRNIGNVSGLLLEQSRTQLEEEGWENAAYELSFKIRDSGVLPVLSLKDRLPEAERELILDEGRAEDYLAALTSKLRAAGWGGLNLNFCPLLPFDREAYSRFAVLAGEAAHREGLWFMSTLPLYAGEMRYSPAVAAYDPEVHGQAAERLVLRTAPLLPIDQLRVMLVELAALVPAGKLLLELDETALVQREDGSVEKLSAAAAQNLAVSAMADIKQRQGQTARFEYRDAAGLHCLVRYADARWLCAVAGLVEEFGLAGLWQPAGVPAPAKRRTAAEMFYKSRTLI